MRLRKPKCVRCHGRPVACTVGGKGYCARCMNTVPGLDVAALEEGWERMLADIKRNPRLLDD